MMLFLFSLQELKMDDILQTLLVEAKTGNWLRMSKVNNRSINRIIVDLKLLRESRLIVSPLIRSFVVL